MRSARGVEQGNYFLGVVTVGQVVARPMVQDIAQQDDLVGFFCMNSINEFAAPRCRAVNVGSNQKLQGSLFPYAMVSLIVSLAAILQTNAKNGTWRICLNCSCWDKSFSGLYCSCSDAGCLGFYRGRLAINYPGAHR